VKLLESVAYWPMAAWIGWALLHFLWQGALLAMLLSALLQLLKRSGAALRYTVACGTLLLMSLCPIATTLELQWRASVAVDARANASSRDAPVLTAPRAGEATLASSAAPIPTTALVESAPAARPLSALPIWAFALWLGGVTILSVRLLGGWLLVRRLINRSSRPVMGPLNASLIDLAKSLRIQRLPRMLECDGVRVPTLIGGLRSVVLLPASALTGLSMQMLESLLAHELAHLKRHDYLVNLWQSAVETVLFYHPAVWWVSKTIRVEREYCCDDVAVSVLRDGATYARALATLEEMRWNPVVLAASGGDLLARIRRLLAPDSSGSAPRPMSLLSLALAVSLACALVAAGGHYFPRATASVRQHRHEIDLHGDGSRQSGEFVPTPHGDANRDASGDKQPSRAAGEISAPESSLPAAEIPSQSDREVDRQRGLIAGETIARSFSPGFELTRSLNVHELKRPISEVQPGSNGHTSEGRKMEPSSITSGDPAASPKAADGGNTDQRLSLDPSTQQPVRPAEPADRPGSTITDIVVIGNKVLNSQAIISLSGHKAGDPFTPTVLNDMRDKLVKSGYFGLHHPGAADKWVRIQGEDIGNNKSKVTIAVDENDRVTGITVTGTGPVKPEEVKALISLSAVYNARVIRHDAQNIIELYNKKGYSIEFGTNLGMDPNNPGILVVPIIVTRVDDIVFGARKHETKDYVILRELKTKKGDYFNRKTFYEQDRARLINLDLFDDVTFTEQTVGADTGRVKLTIDLVEKRAGNLTPPRAGQPPQAIPVNGPTIGEIVVIGNKVLNNQAIMSLSGHKVGDPCTADVPTDMRDKLTKTGNFGMHHPDQADQWVRVQAEDIGDNKCKVTITVDENDKITGITVTGTGPVKPEEVKALISPTTVYNAEDLARDTRRITDLYNKQGYSIEFGKELGMDASHPGLLVIPIIVTRVEDIEISKDGVKSDDPRLLRQLATRAGEFFNRKTFYEVDQKRLASKNRRDDVILTERTTGTGRVHLTIDLLPKKRGKH
jgi:beta-lactamase regulating signal transducer with metallopeptidase domain